MLPLSACLPADEGAADGCAWSSNCGQLDEWPEVTAGRDLFAAKKLAWRKDSGQDGVGVMAELELRLEAICLM